MECKTKRLFYLSSACLKSSSRTFWIPRIFGTANHRTGTVCIHNTNRADFMWQTPFSSLSQKRQILIESKMEKGSNSELENAGTQLHLWLSCYVCIYLNVRSTGRNSRVKRVEENVQEKEQMADKSFTTVDFLWSRNCPKWTQRNETSKKEQG